MDPCRRITDFYYDGEFVEEIRLYKPGEFHPVHLGDTFSFCPGSERPRYRVIHKIGHGYFSTVWLAQDMADHDRGVAIKITRADVQESSILQTLCSPTAGNPHQGQKHVLRLLDHFKIYGPNGTHEALVTDVLIPPQYLRDLHIFDPKRTSYQALLAVAYLTHCGIIHGDLHTENIVFFHPGLTRLSAHEWMESLYIADLSAVIPVKPENQNESLPKYLVGAADLSPVVDPLIKKYGTDDMYAVVIDFGSAFRASDPIPEPNTPPYITAPEMLIRSMHLSLSEEFYKPEWRFYGDIWSLGCSIFEMFACQLFVKSKDGLLEEIINFAGPLPKSWLHLLKEKHRPHLDNDESALITAAEDKRRNIFNGDPGYGSPLRVEEGFHKLLESMLRIDPVSRAHPEQLIQSAWFADLHKDT